MTSLATPDHGLTAAALAGEAILRALAARDQFEPFASQAEVAQATGRAPKNIGREIGQLQTARLVEDAPSNWSRVAVTDAGHAAIAALDKAAGQGVPAEGGGLIFVAPALLDDNPLNPRKVYDADKLEGLADTIEEDERVIEPLNVSPVQPSGRRFVWAGHRRKRAALIVEARFATRGQDLPPGLARGVPCIEREATPAEALFIAVVENGQRENLTPWEDAQGIAALAEATGWSGRELARKTGRAPRLDQGDEEGVRDVQEKIKVVKTAPSDLIEAHEAGLITWEQFRGALRNGKLPTADASMFPSTAGEPRTDDPAPSATPPQTGGELAEPQPVDLPPRARLVLLEICHAARFHPERLVVAGDDGETAYAPTGKYWLDLTASSLQTLRFIDFKHHGRPFVRVTPAGLQWMVETLPQEPIETGLETARNAVGQAGWPGPGYVTDWLNPPPPTAAETAPQQTADDAQTDDVEDAVAAQLHVDAARFVGAAPEGGSGAAWSDLLTRSGTDGPFTTDRTQMGCVIDSQGETVCVVDVDNVLLDDTAHARAVLIAAALNRVCDHAPIEAA